MNLAAIFESSQIRVPRRNRVVRHAIGVARVLVVEDEPRMRQLIGRALAAQGHEVRAAADANAALCLLRSERFEVAAVDVALPGMSGVELCRHVRQLGLSLAIVLVTARDGVVDRIAGLDSGADDYLVKPFAMAELVARVRALLRRAGTVPTSIEVGDLVVDPVAVRVAIGPRTLPFSLKEFGVLRVLAAAAPVAVERSAILAEVWGDPQRFDRAIVDQYVSYVRRKLALAESRVHIATVRGVGYRVEVEP